MKSTLIKSYALCKSITVGMRRNEQANLPKRYGSVLLDKIFYIGTKRSHWMEEVLQDYQRPLVNHYIWMLKLLSHLWGLRSEKYRKLSQ